MIESPWPYLVAYVSLLLVLLALPLLARWRWGLLPSLLVTVGELIAVYVVAYFLIPEPSPPPPMPEVGVQEDVMKGYAEAMARALVWLTLWAVPSLAVVVGGMLCLAWSAVVATRRFAARVE
jgi:hypothetical protein